MEEEKNLLKEQTDKKSSDQDQLDNQKGFEYSKLPTSKEISDQETKDPIEYGLITLKERLENFKNREKNAESREDEIYYAEKIKEVTNEILSLRNEQIKILEQENLIKISLMKEEALINKEKALTKNTILTGNLALILSVLSFFSGLIITVFVQEIGYFGIFLSASGLAFFNIRVPFSLKEIITSTKLAK